MTYYFWLGKEADQENARSRMIDRIASRIMGEARRDVWLPDEELPDIYGALGNFDK